MAFLVAKKTWLNLLPNCVFEKNSSGEAPQGHLGPSWAILGLLGHTQKLEESNAQKPPLDTRNYKNLAESKFLLGTSQNLHNQFDSSWDDLVGSKQDKTPSSNWNWPTLDKQLESLGPWVQKNQEKPYKLSENQSNSHVNPHGKTWRCHPWGGTPAPTLGTLRSMEHTYM
jgi:hypothetical protein